MIDEMQVLAQLAHRSPSVTKHQRSDLSSHSGFDSLPSPLTLNLSLSHLSFSSTVIFPSLWPNYFCLCCAPLAPALQLSLYIEHNFPSSVRISFYALIPPHAQGLISLECSLACLFLPSPRTTALRPLCVSQKPECLPTDKPQLHLIINIVGESEVQVGETARTRWMR